MKYCIHCGQQIKDESKFCAYCGKSQVIDDSTKGTVEKNSVQETISNLKEQAMENKSIKQAVSAGKSYFNFLIENIKNPTFNTEAYHSYYGYISLILLSLFTCITISKGIGSIVNEIYEALAIFGRGFYGSNGMPYIFEFFLYFALSMLAIVLLSYLTTTKILKVSYRFSDVITKFFAPMSLAVVISFFTMILAFLKLRVGKLVLLGLSIIFILQQVCYYAFLLDDKNYVNVKKNKIYIVILNVICLLVINLCTYKLIGEAILRQWF
ncbi:MAG: zinc-ribbon domain-containing protein [Clostridium sp.]